MIASEVRSWLLTQHIKVPSDWLDACLEWLQAENGGRNVEVSRLKQQVFEQWLLTDLTDLGAASLPTDVLDEKYTLSGCHCLQIVSVMDVSQPMYGQLLQMQNKDSPNSLVSAETQATQKPWEKKTSRMLMMNLTDGVTTVSGMEYRNIPCLNDIFPPGTKIKIKGPILCRKGVLMLAASNVQVLGGEVDDLKSTNHKEALLCRALNRPPPAASTTRQNHSIQAAATQESAVMDLDLPPDVISQLTDDSFDVVSADSGFASVQTNVNALSQNPSTGRPGSMSDHAASADIDMEDVNDDDILLETARLESQISSRPNVGRPSSQYDSNMSQKVVTSSRIARQQAVVDLVKEESYLNRTRRSAQLAGKSTPPLSARPRCEDTFRQVTIEDAFKQNYKPLSANLLKTTNNPLGCRQKVPNPAAKANNQLLRDRAHSAPTGVCGSSGAQVGGIGKLDQKQVVSATLSSSHVTKTEPPIVIDLDSDPEFEDCPSLTSRVRRPRLSSSTARMRSNAAATPQLKSSSIKRENCADRSKPVYDLQQPVRYLCQLKHCGINQLAQTPIFVKAFIVTLLSKLQCDPETGWSLKARICDGTGVLDVKFSDSVLTQLIGFEAKRADQIKRSCDRSGMEELRAGMKNCREVIIGLCKIMQITVKNQQPRVVELKDTDESYWAGLLERTR